MSGTGRFSTAPPATARRLPLPADAGAAAAASGTHASRTRLTRVAKSSACASPPTVHSSRIVPAFRGKVAGTTTGIPSVPMLCLIASWDRRDLMRSALDT